MTDPEIFSKLAALENAGVPCCLATLVEARGSTPRSAGAKMIVCADGATFGSVGGGCGERRAKSAALRCLLRGGGPELLEISLADEFGTKGGDVCGGGMSVFVEPARPARGRSSEAGKGD